MQGRVAAPIVLSDEERSCLEGELRHHKVSRSLSDRCRMILLCAVGISVPDHSSTTMINASL
ncbi:MAG: hypothetical protein OIF56_07065 [Cohaesibacter sp.]|nr:hypothetical protein [Cohaesibacter sp.]